MGYRRHLASEIRLILSPHRYAMVARCLALVGALAVAVNGEAAASVPSRLSLSRVAPTQANVELVQPQLRECDSESLADVLRLCGGQTATCDVVLVGCGVPKRGMGWYHAKQMLEGDVPSAKLTAVVEPWFLGAGADSPPGESFKSWADEMESTYGTKFVKDISELEIKVRQTAEHTTQPHPRRLSASAPPHLRSLLSWCPLLSKLLTLPGSC